MKIIELFSGVGAIRKYLGKECETLFISEIDKKIEELYRNIFFDYTTPNFGDIKKITNGQLKPYVNKCDLLFFGSPCVDFSQAGKNLSGDRYSGTRSSLLWDTIKIIKYIKPKKIIFENVKGMISKKHLPILNEYKEELKKLGYLVMPTQLINAKNCGLPQNRERIFTTAYLYPEYINKIETPSHINISLQKFLAIDLLWNKREFIKDIKLKYEYTNFWTWPDKKGNKNSSYNRAWKINSYCGALNTTTKIKITDGIKVSFLIAKEYVLLSGFTINDYNNMIKYENENKIYKAMGNTIPINMFRYVKYF